MRYTTAGMSTVLTGIPSWRLKGEEEVEDLVDKIRMHPLRVPFYRSQCGSRRTSIDILWLQRREGKKSI